MKKKANNVQEAVIEEDVIENENFFIKELKSRLEIHKKYRQFKKGVDKEKERALCEIEEEIRIKQENFSEEISALETALSRNNNEEIKKALKNLSNKL